MDEPADPRGGSDADRQDADGRGADRGASDRQDADRAGGNAAPREGSPEEASEGGRGPSADAANVGGGRNPAAVPSRLPDLTPRAALVIAAAVVIGIGLYLGREALAPFVVGLLLVYLLSPPIDALHRWRVPRWLAILLVYVAVGFLVYQAISFTIRPLVDQLRTFIDDFPTLIARIDELYHGLALPPQVRSVIDEWLAGLGGGGGPDIGVLLPVVNITAGLVSSIFGYLIIPVWAFYLLKDRRQLLDSADSALPESWRADARAVVSIVDRVFGQWIRAQLILGIVVGVATFIGLMILNVVIDPVFGRFALLLALSAGILELLPIIGPIIAAVPAVLLALTAGPQAALAAVILYVVVQQVENTILVPKIQGDAVELHPSAVMFSLVLGGAIAGLLGAILALPVTATARDIYKYAFRRASGMPARPGGLRDGGG